MAKDRRKLQHIHSSILDKQPTPQTLEVGEIAVNNAAEKEFISLKNTDNKVVRISSDKQMITWMEKKEVMPYKGYVKGRIANSTYGENPGAGDAYNSYGITNDDLLENKSQIIIKLNQVAAKNTSKYDKVNAATDKYGNTINPWSGETIGDGAGFYIDMSRYAMNGANPSFSSLTVTDKTDLSGNTTITDGDGTGTRTGKTFTVKVTNENETVTTLNESATTRTTKIGTENLNVSGTTTEVHTGNVTISNKANVTETTDGNSYENVSGTTVINHSGITNYNYTGGTTLSGSTLESITTGNTVIHSDGAIGITTARDIIAISSESDIYITANDDLSATAGDIATFKGVNETNIGIDTDVDEDSVVTNIYGKTINTIGGNVNVTGNTKITGNVNITSGYSMKADTFNVNNHITSDNSTIIFDKKVKFDGGIEGGVASSVKRVTVTQTLSKDDYFVYCMNTNEITLTLPTDAAVGQIIFGMCGTSTVNIEGSIRGSYQTVTLGSDYENFMLSYNGVTWTASYLPYII